METDEQTDATLARNEVLEIKFPEDYELEEVFWEWRMHFPLQRITKRSTIPE